MTHAPQELTPDATPPETTLSIEYYTDPLCSWSWALEPHWRRLRLALPAGWCWRYRMGGMLINWQSYYDPVNEIQRPAQMGVQWYAIQQQTGMPLDDRLWHDAPPASSLPACLAVKAAQCQGGDAAEHYLRRLREAAMLERRDISDFTVLHDLADEIASAVGADFDSARFAADLDLPATEDALRLDMREAAYLQITRFPALLLSDGTRRLLVTGYCPFARLYAACAQLMPALPPPPAPPDIPTYLARWHSAPLGEIALACELAPEEAQAQLAALVAAGKLSRQVTGDRTDCALYRMNLTENAACAQ